MTAKLEAFLMQANILGKPLEISRNLLKVIQKWHSDESERVLTSL